jgi:glycosyltransferase involved in cell wall biosynthesis
MSDEPGYDYYELDRRWIHFVGHGSEPLRSELQGIASDGDRRVKMGRYAFEYASSRFQWDNHCDELLRLYEQAAADVRS